MAKVVDINEYKRKKQKETLDAEMKTKNEQYQFALETGMCDKCGTATDDILLIGGEWVCRPCLSGPKKA